MFHRSMLAAVVAVAAAVLPLRVSAHAGYAGSSPGVDEVLATPPTQVWVQFTEPVTPTSTLLVTDAAGARVDLGDTRRDANNAARLWVSLRPLGPGRYTVRYEVVSEDDGHSSADGFAFTVAGTATPASPTTAPPPPPAAPAAGPAPAPGPVAGHETGSVRVLSDDAAGPVHAHMRVHRQGDRLRFQIPVTNHYHEAINNLEVHIALPHGTTYLQSSTDAGDTPAWDGQVARYYVPSVPGDGRIGPYNFDVRVNPPSAGHPHPTLTMRVWLRYQHDGQWEAYTSTLVIENPLEPGAEHGATEDGGH